MNINKCNTRDITMETEVVDPKKTKYRKDKLFKICLHEAAHSAAALPSYAGCCMGSKVHPTVYRG